METDSKPVEFRPEKLSRRGEFIAWGSAGLVGLAWLALLLTGKPVSRAVPWLTVALLLMGLGISLSNWMDRRAFIRLEPGGITFENGLRHTHLQWDQINQVQVLGSAWGKKVRVLGEQTYFEFRTLGEVKLQGEVKGRLGYEHGDFILNRIIDLAGLKETRHLDGGYYYARE